MAHSRKHRKRPLHLSNFTDEPSITRWGHAHEVATKRRPQNPSSPCLGCGHGKAGNAACQDDHRTRYRFVRQFFQGVQRRTVQQLQHETHRPWSTRVRQSAQTSTRSSPRGQPSSTPRRSRARQSRVRPGCREKARGPRGLPAGEVSARRRPRPWNRSRPRRVPTRAVQRPGSTRRARNAG